MSQVVHFCSLAPGAFVWVGDFREYLCLKGEGGKKKRRDCYYYYYYYYYYYTRFVDLAQKLTMELLIFSDMRGGARTCADNWKTNTIII
jgi:hypothetical protein